MSWSDGFEPILRADVPLREHTWFHLGGPARWMAAPRDEAELAALVNRAEAAGVPWRVLGHGANVLVRDEGFPGVVIRLEAPAFSSVQYADPTPLVTAGAGVDFPRFIRDTLKRGLVGLEALAGVPGTVGGLVRMNAGGKYGETGQFVRKVRVLTKDRQIADLSREQVGFRYRHTELAGCIVLGATFELTPGDSTEGLARHRNIWTEKHDSQPAVSLRSAGCIFKNPPGQSAGKLLDQAGLKETRVGGAMISAKHANFIVADDTATAQHVIDLIRAAKDRVHSAAGVMLETEIEIW